LGRPAIPISAVLLLILLALDWGLLWPAMKFAVGEMPYMTFRMATSLGASSAIFAMLAIFGRPLRISRAEVRPLIVASLFNVTGWLGFSGWGLTLVTAGRATVLAYTMPVWAFLAATIILNERGGLRHAVGVICGLGAVATLVSTDLDRLSDAPLGVLAMLGAAMSWGIGAVLQRRIAWTTPMTTITAWQLLLGGIPLTILALVFEPHGVTLATPSAWAATAFAALIGTALGLNIWFKILQLVPTNVASLGVLPVPLIGVFAAAVALGEPTGWPELTALALVTAALATIMPMPRLWGKSG
jgi:drug/metabolite transporter (DMT)-like permease